jgi:hypothetical protein
LPFLIVGILSIKNGKDTIPIEDNCLEEERSDDSNYCLRWVVLNVRDAYDVFCAIVHSVKYLMLTKSNYGQITDRKFRGFVALAWQ